MIASRRFLSVLHTIIAEDILWKLETANRQRRRPNSVRIEEKQYPASAKHDASRNRQGSPNGRRDLTLLMRQHLPERFMLVGQSLYQFFAFHIFKPADAAYYSDAANRNSPSSTIPSYAGSIPAGRLANSQP